MTEIPTTSDLHWWAAMNRGPVAKHRDTANERTVHTGATERVFGYYPVKDAVPIPSGTLAEVADLVDDVFAEQIFPDSP